MAFGINEIIVQKINDAKFKAFYVGFDLGSCRLGPFCDILLDALVDFAYGYHCGILKTYDRRKLIEAARSIYKIQSYQDAKWTYVDNDSVLDDNELKAEDKYKKRGEFGELILHVILRDCFYTTPLISKIFFKDTDGVTVHGFDAVHIGPELPSMASPSLYLGESKIYYRGNGNAGKFGIQDLIDDIKSHFKCDFLKREFAVISKKRNTYPILEEYSDENTKRDYENYLRQREYWHTTLQAISEGKSRFDDLLPSVTIPLICTYQSDIFKKCPTDTHPDFTTEFEAEANSLKEKFEELLSAIEKEDGEPIKTDLNIILILIPIPSKKDLIKMLHQKLYNQQNA